MVMRPPDIVDAALSSVTQKGEARVVDLSPRGRLIKSWPASLRKRPNCLFVWTELLLWQLD